MTFSKQPGHYPPEYFNLLTQLENEPEKQIRLECKDLKEAQRERARIYFFRKAVEEDDALLQLYPGAASLMILMEGTTLVVLHRDHSPAALMVREALAKMNQDKESKDEQG